jgi:hypothetical protein
MINQISVSCKIYDSIFKAKDIMDSEYEDVLAWITDIIENPQRLKQKECEICNSNKKLEQHHVRGRKHGNKIMTVCQECHEILTANQRLWDRSWLDSNSENKGAFLEIGLIDICDLKYEKTGQEIFKRIAEQLKRGFSYE